MTVRSYDIELIEKYIDNSINDLELLEFKEKLRGSPEFREAVEFQIKLIANIEALEKKRLKEELTLMFADIPPEKKSDSDSVKKWFLVAAGVLVLLTATMIWRLQALNNEALFDKYYEPFPAKGIVRGDIPDTEIDQIMYTYSAGEYTDVIAMIENQMSRDVYFEGQKLYLGNAYLQTSKMEKAVQSFESIPLESRYRMDGKWYLALAFLKTGDEQSAKKILQGISEENSIYRSSAKKLLEDLN